eukprot:Nk52_evm47s270 gene=Nk52_evmTU47s270
MEGKNTVFVKVPATTANMGSGFDSMGMAVDIWNDLRVTKASHYEMTIEGEGKDFLPKDDKNLVVVGLKAAFKTAGKEVPPLKFECVNRIPFSRGLGSSSAAIVSGIIAGLVLAGHELPVHGEEELLQIAASIEGHPDNVAPAIYGGFQIGVHTGSRWFTSRVRIPYGLQCTLFVPDKGCETSEARALLGNDVKRDDAIFNIGRAAMLVHAFFTDRLEDLSIAMDDRLHQPARSQILPALYPMIKAATAAGAHGCFLSGAGSTILALTSGRSGDIYTQRESERKETAVKDAFLKISKEYEMPGRIFITKPTETGAHVVSCE